MISISLSHINTSPSATPTAGALGNISWDFTRNDNNDAQPIEVDDDNIGSNNNFTIKVICQVDELRGAGINEENDTLTNHALMNFGGATADVEDPTDPTVTVSEPEIVTTKTVENSRNGGTDAILGELLTYTVRFENDGSSTAFEVTALDTLPAGVNFQSLTSAIYRDNSDSSNPVDTNILGNTEAVENYTDDTTQSTLSFASNSGNAADSSWDIKAGDYIELTYTVKVIGAGLTEGSYENVIDADWSSQNGNTAVERVYEDTGGTDGIGGNKYGVDARRDDANATFSVELGSIGDLVWYDANENDTQEAGGHEPGLANVGVTLTADLNGDGVINVSDGDISRTTTTGADGSYLFDDLLLGEYKDGSLSLYDYKVEIDHSTVASYYEVTYDLDGINTPHQTSIIHLDPTVPAVGIDRDDIDFGYTDNGSIGDKVWFDVDGDGVQDANEPGIAGVEVTLVGNTDGLAGDETITLTTDSNGNYTFSHLPPGNYSVSVDNTTLPVGMTHQTYDLDDVTSPDRVNSVSLTQGQQREDVDFGYNGTGSIGDTVWKDNNKNGVIDNGEQGISGVKVALEADFDNDGNTDYSTSAVTDASGRYLFTNLPAGSYQIEVVESSLPGSLNQTYDLDGTKDHETTITLSDAEDRFDADFGYVYVYVYVLPTSSIGDRIWNDLNADGVQDAGEYGLGGITVTLSGVDINNDGTLDTLTTVTDVNGVYGFAGLTPGAYTIAVDSSTVPSGYIQSGDPDSVKDNVSTYNLVLGEHNRDQDFGYTETGSIGDTVWYDVDGDGIQDINEPGLAGIEVTLHGDVDLDGNQDTRTTVTDINGKYLFGNLPTGDYSITLTGDDLPAGMVPTYDEDGTATQHTTDVNLGNADDNLDIDFGYRGTGSIGDTVWYDLDEDGVVDPGEEGIAGVKVTLEGDFDGDGVTDMVLETTTDASGKYSFKNLFAGEYSITSNPSTITDNYYPVYDADGTLDNTTTIQLAAGEVNNNVDFGYRPITVPPEPSTPSLVVPPVVPPVTPVPEIATPYDPLFQSYVEGGEDRDVDTFINMRRDDLVFQEPLLPVSPIYTGHAEPGTTLYINLTDAQGNLVGSQLVMADTGGNWLANFSGTLMYDMPHNIEIQQDMSLYNASSAGGFNLRTYFMPALSTSPFTTYEMTIDSIFATRPFAILEALGEHYNQSSNLAWNDFYDYEVKAVSTNPSQSTL